VTLYSPLGNDGIRGKIESLVTASRAVSGKGTRARASGSYREGVAKRHQHPNLRVAPQIAKRTRILVPGPPFMQDKDVAG
jgi:hypothetical protein